MIEAQACKHASHPNLKLETVAAIHFYASVKLNWMMHVLHGKEPPPAVCYTSRVRELSKYGFSKCIVISLVNWLVEFY